MNKKIPIYLILFFFPFLFLLPHTLNFLTMGNNLKIIIETQKGGWLSFIDNWHPNWKVIINNKQYPVYKLFNAYKVVYISPGISIVEFKFKIF